MGRPRKYRKRFNITLADAGVGAAKRISDGRGLDRSAVIGEALVIYDALRVESAGGNLYIEKDGEKYEVILPGMKDSDGRGYVVGTGQIRFTS